MKRIFIFFIGSMCLSGSVFAHRLNEYLLASTIAITKNHLTLRMHLTAGEYVANEVLAGIDKNKNGVITTAEQLAYVKRLRGDLRLVIDGKLVSLKMHSLSFPDIEDIKKGIGDILVSFEADLPNANSTHNLTLKNYHQKLIAIYMVNCLAPIDPGISIIGQNRNYDQSMYQLNFKVNNLH